MSTEIKKFLFISSFFLLHPILFLERINCELKVKTINPKIKNSHTPFVSIIIVTYNALNYVKICLTSLKKTKYKNKEVIVVDNNSQPEVKRYLQDAKRKKLIDTLYLSSKNTYFSGGNNIGASLAKKKSEYLVLLNSDIEIKDPDWLNILVKNNPKRGIISFGKTDVPVLRPDGWCFLIDKKTYHQFGGLNEYYQMNWSMTQLTGRVLQTGLKVKAIANPNNYIYHFGQKSWPKKNKLQFNQMSLEQVLDCFGKHQIQLLKIKS